MTTLPNGSSLVFLKIEVGLANALRTAVESKCPEGSEGHMQRDGKGSSKELFLVRGRELLYCLAVLIFLNCGKRSTIDLDSLRSFNEYQNILAVMATVRLHLSLPNQLWHRLFLSLPGMN